MQDICDQWRSEMRGIRWERRFMITAIVILAGYRVGGF